MTDASLTGRVDDWTVLLLLTYTALARCTSMTLFRRTIAVVVVVLDYLPRAAHTHTHTDAALLHLHD